MRQVTKKAVNALMNRERMKCGNTEAKNGELFLHGNRIAWLVIQIMKDIALTEEQIKTIAHALRTTMRVNQESVNTMYEVCGVNNDTTEVANVIIEGNICLRTLLDYIESV